jgi:hypothetical protein
MKIINEIILLLTLSLLSVGTFVYLYHGVVYTKHVLDTKDFQIILYQNMFFILMFCLLQKCLSYWTVSLSKYVIVSCGQDSHTRLT